MRLDKTIGIVLSNRIRSAEGAKCQWHLLSADRSEAKTAHGFGFGSAQDSRIIQYYTEKE